ncbi:hypothetical protein DFJ67_6435 [Asanoa ferruginea]|uniref:Lipoprotein n=1 Tax=Asanoa ferruginea TaxID=53367 RepID=A0A3D9ZV58_9ACTN|nr:hypothetical protein [Asanoa ferruginea]REG00383.1 hypothetical protein DFJ67_6435 [Asanoa ferruginea]GIF52735.1 hypothetical protein Afe04nite_72740 [Asanoa ferruginea]
MRRGIATVFVLAVVGLGAAACGSGGDAADSLPTSGADAGVVDVKAVATVNACKEAIADSDARQQELADSLDELSRADNADEAAPIDKAVDYTMQWWANQLTLLSGRDIDSIVKTTLTDAATTITKLNDPKRKTTLRQAMPTLEGIPTTIKNVCL